MFFTHEDYRKIEKWLTANSKKDTDFVGATTPLKGNETVVLVQNGKNVKTSVKDIVDQFFLLGVSDFLNITDKYGESYISINQAIQLIPFRSRKVGQVITFIDESGNWAIYQFQGKALNQWNNTTLWIDLLAKISGIPIIDSEDITTKENGAKQVSLYLADKQYNEADYSGLGKIYLRKNIQNIIDPSTGAVINVNLLTQSMLAKENTIYILQYDYNLNNQTITIPEGCILDMRGGSVTNGTINCVDTIIISTDDSKLDVTLTGTYRFDSEKLVTLNTEDINIIQSVDRKSHTISAMLADRDTTNGMGYVILRKDKSFASQLTQQNTIYEIRYDFTLNENITIPANCILEFEGGSINGAYTLTGANTGINAGLVKIFNTDVTLVGTWNISEAYPEWFGAKGDGVQIDTTSIQKTLDIGVNVYLQNKLYLTDDLKIIKSIKLYGLGTLKHIPTSTEGTTNGYELINVISNDVTIDSITLIGDRDEHIGTAGEFGICCVVRGKSCKIHNCNISKAWGDGIYVYGDSVTIDNCFINNCGRNGISVIKSKDFLITNCSIKNTNRTAPMYAIDVEPNSGDYANGIIRNIFTEENKGGSIAINYIGGTINYGSVIVDNIQSLNDGLEHSEGNGLGVFSVYIANGQNNNIVFDHIISNGSNIHVFGAKKLDSAIDTCITFNANILNHSTTALFYMYNSTNKKLIVNSDFVWDNKNSLPGLVHGASTGYKKLEYNGNDKFSYPNETSSTVIVVEKANKAVDISTGFNPGAPIGTINKAVRLGSCIMYYYNVEFQLTMTTSSNIIILTDYFLPTATTNLICINKDTQETVNTSINTVGQIRMEKIPSVGTYSIKGFVNGIRQGTGL